jgi:hypothetical protein
MSALLIQWLIVLLLWIGGWGIVEMFVERIAKCDNGIRFALYFLILIIGVIAFLVVDAFWPDDAPSD